jgi:putative restriction endonuclease
MVIPLPILNREQLNTRIIEAVQQCGWNVLHISPLSASPFNLRIYNESSAEMLKIYSWNLTHGGKKRKEDEYRIQVKVTKFTQEADYKTLVLGWWDDIEVFAGFDVRKHSGTLGYSSSIQVSKETLRKAIISGIATHDKGNNEIAVAFRPDFFVDYVRNLEALHEFGESVRDLKAFETVIDKAAIAETTLNQTELDAVSKPRQSVVRTITQKVREAGFKRRVLTAYSHQCAFCSLQLKLIDAAHIIPVAHTSSTDKTANGIALCSLHHRAFDKALITINSNYETLINDKKMAHLKAIGHDGGADKFIRDIRPIIHIPPALSDRPHVSYVTKANKLRGWT